MDRTILHCDLNNFYASVEMAKNPQLRDVPMAVCGDIEQRHGIILSKNYLAKSFGVKTGETIGDAKKKCGNLQLVKADSTQYLAFSRTVRKIYEMYTDMVESFGIDECWLDVSGSKSLFGDGLKIADEIREKVKQQTQCTISVGVSWNKVYAKLGSDLKSPDAVSVIDRQNYKDIVFKQPVGSLLYVGRSTKEKLNKFAFYTIGDLAAADVDFLTKLLGKWGATLWTYANGLDQTPVYVSGQSHDIKSVGNSSTLSRDLLSRDDVLMAMTMLSESVAERLRENNLRGREISVSFRDNGLDVWGKQTKIQNYTSLSSEILQTAMYLYDNFYDKRKAIRSAGVRVSDFEESSSVSQLDMFVNQEVRQKNEFLENTVDRIRGKYGRNSINRGVAYLDKKLTDINPKDDNKISFMLNNKGVD